MCYQTTLFLHFAPNYWMSLSVKSLIDDTVHDSNPLWIPRDRCLPRIKFSAGKAGVSKTQTSKTQTPKKLVLMPLGVSKTHTPKKLVLRPLGVSKTQSSKKLRPPPPPEKLRPLGVSKKYKWLSKWLLHGLIKQREKTWVTIFRLASTSLH